MLQTITRQTIVYIAASHSVQEEHLMTNGGTHGSDKKTPSVRKPQGKDSGRKPDQKSGAKKS